MASLPPSLDVAPRHEPTPLPTRANHAAFANPPSAPVRYRYPRRQPYRVTLTYQLMSSEASWPTGTWLPTVPPTVEGKLHGATESCASIRSRAASTNARMHTSAALCGGKQTPTGSGTVLPSELLCVLGRGRLFEKARHDIEEQPDEHEATAGPLHAIERIGRVPQHGVYC